MDFKIIWISARCAVLEREDGSIFYTKTPYYYEVKRADGEGEAICVSSDRVIETVYGLTPATEYVIRCFDGAQETETAQAIGGAQSNGSAAGTEFGTPKTFTTAAETLTMDVRAFGAKGDGASDDTIFIQTAITACPPGGRILVPAGTYKITSIFLKSDTTLELAKGAVLSAFTEREKFPILQAMTPREDGEKDFNMGSWEGNPYPCFSGIVTGLYLKNCVITGEGVIDGNASFDNWWAAPQTPVGGAYRPRLMFINHCENVVIHGITVRNSPSWTLHPYFSDHTRWIDLEVQNPAISPNTDGMDPESVEDIEIVGIHFSVGDDCIAINSGRYEVGNYYKKPSRHIRIRQCHMERGHGAVVIGSGIAAGVYDMRVEKCLFTETDRGLRIKTRRGRGNLAVVRDIVFSEIEMDGVLSPFVVNGFYYCDPDGHEEWVQDKNARPIDEKTPYLEQLHFEKIRAKNCHHVAAYIYGIPEVPVDHISFEDVYVDFAEDAKEGEPAMMDGCDVCRRRGIVVYNTRLLELKNVVIEGTEGERIEAHQVETIKEQ